jgi:hypothetical protein
LTIKLKLTLTNRLHVNWSATVSFETLRVFVVGKNYRVQNIQLSKIRLAGTLPAICLRRLGWRAARAAQQQPPPTSVGARLNSLIRSPKLFK